jgi:uncharacterized membrane protein YgcG
MNCGSLLMRCSGLNEGSIAMMRRFVSKSAPALPVVMALVFLVGCGTTTIASRWRGQDVLLGRNDEGWLASAAPMEDKRTSVAVYNDSEYVYIGLVTADRDLQRLITRTGVSWWFDRDGGNAKSFGVHYPVFSRPPAQLEGESAEGDAPPGDMRGDDRRSDSGEMDVYTSGEEHPVRMTVAATGGIDAEYHVSKGTLSYVLKVPLSDKGVHPFALNAAPGATIGVGAETAFRRPVQASGGEGRRSGGGGGVSGGRRGGGGGGGGRGERQQGRPEDAARPDPLQAWIKVQLATRQ